MKNVILVALLVAAVAAGDVSSPPEDDDNCSSVFAYAPPIGGKFICTDGRRVQWYPRHPESQQPVQHR